MANGPLLAGLLLGNFFLFGLFPTYMVGHMFAFQVVPGPPALSEAGAVVSGLFYISVYPLEMWAPWLGFPALAPPLTATAIGGLSFAIWRGRHVATTPLLLTVVVYNGLEVLASGYAAFLMLVNIAIGNEATLTGIAWAVVPLGLRIALAALAIGINRKVLRGASSPAVVPAA